MSVSFEEGAQRARQYTRMHRKQDASLSSPRRAYEVLRASIRDGLLRPDERLIEHELVQQLGATRNAVRGALHLLAREGVVSREARLGTRLNRELAAVDVDDMVPMEMLDRDQRKHRIEMMYEGVVAAPYFVRNRFGTDDDEALMMEYVAVFADEPLYVRTIYFRRGANDQEFLERAAELITSPVPIKESFQALHRTPSGTITGTFEAVPCEGRTATLLSVAPSSPILLHQSVLQDVTGAVREISYTHHRGDRVAISSTWSSHAT